MPQNGGSSGVDLTFATHLAAGFVRRMSNPKPHWNLKFASVPLVLTFENEAAAVKYACQNRDTGY